MGIVESGAHQESEGDFEWLGVNKGQSCWSGHSIGLCTSKPCFVLAVSCLSSISLTSLWC